MAKRGDGWLRGGMGGLEGRWVAQKGVHGQKGDGWLKGSWVAKKEMV